MRPEVRVVKVLDQGFVRFVGSMGTDETVIEAARMSTGKGFRGWGAGIRCARCGLYEGATVLDLRGGEECAGSHDYQQEAGDAKLLEFLYKNAHHTPFEMCELALEVQAPVMVFREWFRHRIFSINEFSARYAQMPNLHYLPELERFQKQSTVNKQGSGSPFLPDEAHDMLAQLEFEQAGIYRSYDSMVKQGLAKEVARLNTPVSRYSKARVKGDLRGWLGFLNLRMRPNAQFEIRQYANAVASIVKELWPRSYALFEEYDLKGVRLSWTEAVALNSFIHGGSARGERVPNETVKKLEGG